MAYAQLPDLKSRAGVLAKAWGPDTAPGDGDLDRFLDQTAAELDAGIGAGGWSVPLTDEVAAGALVGVNADMALLLAIDATWPGGTGDVLELRNEIRTRVDAYTEQIKEGKLAALLYLGASQAGEQLGGASNYWTANAQTYDYWEWYVDRLSGYFPSASFQDPYGVPIAQGPRFARNMRL